MHRSLRSLVAAKQLEYGKQEKKRYERICVQRMQKQTQRKEKNVTADVEGGSRTYQRKRGVQFGQQIGHQRTGQHTDTFLPPAGSEDPKQQAHKGNNGKGEFSRCHPCL